MFAGPGVDTMTIMNIQSAIKSLTNSTVLPDVLEKLGEYDTLRERGSELAHWHAVGCATVEKDAKD